MNSQINPLPGWRRPPRGRFVVLFTDFGDGAAVLDLWQAWHDDPDRSERIDLIALCAEPPTADTLRRRHAGTARARGAEHLAERWPPATRNLHRLDLLGDGHACLWLAVGAPAGLLFEITAQVDLFIVDRGAALRHEPVRLGKALARLAAPGARVFAALDPQEIGSAWKSAGFRIDAADTSGTQASYAPAFTPRRGRDPARDETRRALIVGGGLAGCAAAWALTEQGWSSVIIERRPGPATEASSNPAGLFHGTVHAGDAPHARFNRAAALHATPAVRAAIDDDGVPGATDGLLRLCAGDAVEAMQALLARLGLPPTYAQALDAAEASRRCGLPLSAPAWFFPGGGWVDPAGLARSFLRRAAVNLRLSQAVHRLHRDGDEWQLLDDRGGPIERAATVVLANAHDALRLLGADFAPLEAVRGQISGVDQRRLPAPDRWRLPRVPLAGSGYLLPEVDGVAWFGATAQRVDDDPTVRETDHRFNLDRLQRLSPGTLAQPTPAWTGRVGWRCVAPDRLPLIGAVPEALDTERPGDIRLDHWPRRPGLHVFAALASRGITWSALGARLLAAQIAGAPLPLEKALVAAVDPARFLVRRHRRR